MNARKHSSLLLRRLSSELSRFQPMATELQRLLDEQQNEGTEAYDGSFSDESWNAAAAASRAFRELKAKVDYAVDMAEATEVGRRKKP